MREDEGRRMEEGQVVTLWVRSILFSANETFDMIIRICELRLSYVAIGREKFPEISLGKLAGLSSIDVLSTNFRGAR